jgi:hypothetical protein
MIYSVAHTGFNSGSREEFSELLVKHNHGRFGFTTAAWTGAAAWRIIFPAVIPGFADNGKSDISAAPLVSAAAYFQYGETHLARTPTRGAYVSVPGS